MTGNTARIYWSWVLWVATCLPLVAGQAGNGLTRERPIQRQAPSTPVKDRRPYNLFIELRPGHFVFWADTRDDRHYVFRSQQLDLRIGLYSKKMTLSENMRGYHALSLLNSRPLGKAAPLWFSCYAYCFGQEIDLAKNRLCLDVSTGLGIYRMGYPDDDTIFLTLLGSIGIGYRISPRDILYLNGGIYCGYKTGIPGPKIDTQKTEVIIWNLSLGLRHSFNLFRKPPRGTG